MKVRPDKFRGFILTAETSYEKDILDCFGGQWFTSRHGVGADMLFRVTNKDAPLEVWKDGERQPTPQGQNAQSSTSPVA